MGFTWQPRWVRKKLSESGIEVVTCVDETTNLIVCPICVNIDELCPPNKPSSKQIEGVSLFFSIKDLIQHMYTHIEESWREKILPKELKESEEEEH